MIEYDNFIYLDVYRTGSTHVIGLLEQICEGRPVRAFRHSSLTKARPLGLTGGKRVFTSVRNPWDWYVSLWAYGADGKSAIRRHLARKFNRQELVALYDKTDPVASFRRWLGVVHDPAILNAAMKEHMPESGLAPVIGLYTYRFLRVTTRYPRLLLRRPFINSPAGAVSYHRMMKAYGAVLRNETLSDDLVNFVIAHPAGFRSQAADIIRAADSRPANTSGRTLPSYRAYYRDIDAALVSNRDQFFADEFGYAF
jgi:hypothetical protein